MTFHELVKSLHPDANGGDRSKTVEFTELMRLHRGECRCGCGRQRPHNRSKFYNNICHLRYRSPQLKTLVAVLLAVACMGAGLPPMPPVKKKVQALHSPKGKELYSSVSMAVAIVLPPKNWFLVWDYPLPLPRPGIGFDVEFKASPTAPWVRVGSTNQPPFPITTQGLQGWYRVGSHWTQ